MIQVKITGSTLTLVGILREENQWHRTCLHRCPYMAPNNVISLSLAREMRKIKEGDPIYQNQILQMDKLELLEEMMKFQDERTKLGYLTVVMMIRGQILFKALEENAETQELRTLAKSYRRHLRYELDAFLQNQKNASAAQS